MASVRMSEDLRSRIVQKAKLIFQPGIVKANGKLAPDFHNRLLDAVYKQVVTDHPFMQKNPINTWPDTWVKEIGGINVTLYKNKDTYDHYMITENISSTYQIPKTSFETDYGDRLKCPKFYSESLFDEYDTYKQRIAKKIEEQNKFVKELQIILKRCNTLKQFLNAWPHGENLVPPDALQKHYAVPEPRVNPVDHIAPEVSADLSTTLVKKTIMNAGN